MLSFNHRLNSPTVMTSDEEWIEKFRKQVRDVMERMLAFEESYVPLIENRLEDPIKNEKSIRRILGSFGGCVTIGSPRGTNRGEDTEAFGRQVTRSCENDKCKKNHCQQCGQCGAKAGDGHTPWYALDLPVCEPKPASRRDRRDRE